LASGVHVFRQLRWPVKILLLLAVASFFFAGAIVVTGQPGFCNSCHIMNSYYDSWQASTHSNVNCLDCHLQPGFTGYIKGKVNGLAQLVDCVVGRVGTKPSAVVMDTSCLRPGCHSVEEITSTTIDYGGVKFSHDNHVRKTVDGLAITCGTCHSHFEGTQHFNVNNNACFSCHFLREGGTNGKLVKTACRDCHEVPNKVIQRGLVTINHAEFVSYNASCEQSCHKKEVQKISQVADTACLNCHSYRKEREPNGVALHELHSQNEKVECFACHGQIMHGQTGVESLAVMMDCQNCHSNTHQVQRTIYATQQPMPQDHPAGNPLGGTDRVLSPMFLTHVECTGCHIDPVQKEAGALNSFGTVARAVPRACDVCHKEGTGQQYVPFWQKKIKAKYAEVELKINNLEAQGRAAANEGAAGGLRSRLKQAKAILQSVSADGSWGVHNFKYTEAMLLRANELVSEAK
jgi:hypothetical protein